VSYNLQEHWKFEKSEDQQTGDSKWHSSLTRLAQTDAENIELLENT